VAHNSVRQYFERYVLDLERGSLLLDGNEIALRPKTFAVLRYLVENSGRLVSKDELFNEVWPNLAVTDDALVQSIGELRKAFGDDGPRLIKTIPRRGYRFESAVSDAAPDVAALNVIVGAPTASSEGTTEPARRQRHMYWLAAGGLAVVLVAAAIWSNAGILRTIGLGDWFGSQKPALGAKPGIAVLPFANQSDDASRDYFADGLTQDILNALGRFSALTVMSWMKRVRRSKLVSRLSAPPSETPWWPVQFWLSTGRADSNTTPSTGTFSPGRTRRRSPFCTASSEISSSELSLFRRRADLAARPSNFRMAAPVWLRARSSNTCPSKIKVTMTPAASK